MQTEKKVLQGAAGGAPHEPKMVIGGELVDAADGATFESVNPANGEVTAHIPKGGLEDVDRAVRAAVKAFESEGWHDMSTIDRGRMMQRLTSLIEDSAEELAQMETRDNGKAIFEARSEVKVCLSILDYYAGLATKITGATVPHTPGTFMYTRREPVGVVGQIIPWNSPLLMFVARISPALAAGCTIVIKPASYTTMTALTVGRMALEAGIPSGVLNVLTPSGVLNVLTGPGEEVGMGLVRHPDVRKIAVTGETSTGKVIAQAAAETLKRVSLELGGKSANIIFGDAHLDCAVPAAAWGVFGGAGQSCVAGSRVLVQRGIHEEFVDRFAAYAQRIRVGHPLDPDTRMGSQVSQRQLSTFAEYVDIGRAEGAVVRAGGERPSDPELANGAFDTPTVLVGHERDARRPRGDLRAGRRRDPLRHRGRRDPDRERQQGRPRGRGVDDGLRSGAPCRARDRGGHGLGQHVPAHDAAAPVRRLQGEWVGTRVLDRGHRSLHGDEGGLHEPRRRRLPGARGLS